MTTPSRDISRLIEIMAALRTPVTGCPWDIEQTFASIAPYTLEEAYEVADAIARGDLADLEEELGDLLLQVVYHARMAEEQQAFAFGDVVHAITAKMIRRHPHVFGDEATRSLGAAQGWWDRIKAEEKAVRVAERARLAPNGAAVEPAGKSLLDDIGVGMPALSRAVKLQDKAAKVGFDWPSLEPVLDKMKEELAELDEAIEAGRTSTEDGSSRAQIEEEFGDLMFVMANVARHLKLDPEAALRGANEKFRRRFRHIEQRLAERGSSPDQSNLAEMDALWNEAKAHEAEDR